MVKWVRSGVLEGAPELVAELGGNYAALARETGLPPRPMDQPDLPVAADAVVRFLDLAATRLGEAAFGLRLGMHQTFGLFGPMAPLLESAETVGGMFADLIDYFPLHTQGMIVGLERERAGALLTYELATGSGPEQRQVIELGFGVILRELRRYRPAWTPPEIYLRHAPPADTAWHRRLLGPGVTFNADRNAMLIDREILALPTIAGSRAVHEPLAAQFGDAAKSAGALAALRTEALVRAMLPFAPIDLAIAARMLGFSRRTLQRRLAADSTTFDRIVDQVRSGLAYSYLRESNLAVGEIAEILQFSETSALSRAVRRWQGAAPRTIRGNLRRIPVQAGTPRNAPEN